MWAAGRRLAPTMLRSRLVIRLALAALQAFPLTIASGPTIAGLLRGAVTHG